MHKKLIAAGSMIALGVSLASCAASGSVAAESGNAEVFLYEGDDRQKYLEECAAEEGNEVQWYTSLAGQIHDGIIEGFHEKYPGIEIVTFRGDETDISSRVVQEANANKFNGDVIELSSDAYRQLVAFGAIGEFATPHSPDYSDRFTIKSESGNIQGLGDRTSYVGFAYNTDKLPADAVPSTWEDLLGPDLKGKLALTDSTTGVRMLGNILTNVEDGEGFIKSLGEQDVRIESVSGSALAEMIASGEVTSSPGIFRNHVQQMEGSAPIKWVPLEPVTANVGYAGVFAQAPHPCSAMLFLDFMLSSEGAEIYNAARYPRPDEDLGFTSWVPDESYDNVEAYEEASTMWLKTFDSAFR